MEGANPLDQLRDIHLPADVSWWPLAYGWWLLLAVLLIAITVITVAVLRHLANNRYRKLAVAELEQLTRQNLSDSAFVAQLSALLKRAAIAKFGTQCAALHSDAWLAFLLKHCAQCDAEQLAIICTGQYQHLSAIERPLLVAQTRLWLERHKPC